MENEADERLFVDNASGQLVQMREYEDLVYVRPVDPDAYSKIARYVPEDFADNFTEITSTTLQ